MDGLEDHIGARVCVCETEENGGVTREATSVLTLQIASHNALLSCFSAVSGLELLHIMHASRNVSLVKASIQSS